VGTYDFWCWVPGGEPEPQQRNPLEALPKIQDKDQEEWFNKWKKDNPDCITKINNMARENGIEKTFEEVFQNTEFYDAANAPNWVLNSKLSAFGETGRAKDETLKKAFVDEQGQALAIWTAKNGAGEDAPIVIASALYGALGNKPVVTAHELLHILFKDYHVGIAGKLKLGTYSNDKTGDAKASSDITAWLNNNCEKQKPK
jgi:hypothetical protein